MKRSILTSMGLGMMMLIGTVCTANADTLNYTFNINNAGISGGPWATITLTDTTYLGKDSVHFVIDPLDGAFSSTNNFGLQDFYFNEYTGRTNLLSELTVSLTTPPTPAEWVYVYSPTSNIGGVGPYGKFEFKLNGDGNSRSNPLDFYLSTSAFDIQATQFAVSSPILRGNGTDYLFAGHIAGFTVDGNNATSAQFASDGTPGTPVPEPGTMMLLGFGMFGLAIFGKRRMNK